jgi:hypothetical protein
MTRDIESKRDAGADATVLTVTRPTCGCRRLESESTRRVPLTYRVFQPPTPSTRLSASFGPHVPGSYSYIGLGP